MEMTQRCDSAGDNSACLTGSAIRFQVSFSQPIEAISQVNLQTFSCQRKPSLVIISISSAIIFLAPSIIICSILSYHLQHSQLLSAVCSVIICCILCQRSQVLFYQHPQRLSCNSFTGSSKASSELPSVSPSDFTILKFNL